MALYARGRWGRRVPVAKAAYGNEAPRNETVMRDWWDVAEFVINLALVLALLALAVLVYVEIAHG